MPDDTSNGTEGSDARDSSPDFAAMRARSTRRLTLLGGGGLLAALAVGGYVLWSAQRSARLEVESSVSELRACLLGGPLEPKENAALRIRRLQLRALDHTDTELVTLQDKLWPFTCRQPTTRVLTATKDQTSDAQQKSLTDLSGFLDKQSAVSRDASALIDLALATLDAIHPGAIAKGAEPLPLAALNVDTLATVTPLSQKGASFSQTFTEDNPGLSLPVLIDDQDLPAPLLCRFRGAELGADCRALTELNAVHGHGLRLLGTSDPDAPNLIFAGNRGSEGIFLAGAAAPVDHLYSYGGFSAKDGSVSILGYDESQPGLVLVQKPGTLPTVRTPLKPNFRIDNYFYGSQILWDQVLVRGVTPDNERRLFTLPLEKTGKSSFELADIGELAEPGAIRPGEEAEPHLTGCRTDQATVVRVRGYDHDFLTFRINGAFSMPVPAATEGVLGCYGASATLVWVDKPGSEVRLHHDACTSAGCTTALVQGHELDHDTTELRVKEKTDLVAVDLAGQLLTVWIAGDRGGLRLRMAPPEAFARTPDTLVFDDHVADGKVVDASTILGFRLYSRANFAVLLLSTLAGVHAFRIDTSGALSPFAVKMSK
jgi:hypothetical protein